MKKYSYLVAVYPEGNSRYRVPKTRGVRLIGRVRGGSGATVLSVQADCSSEIWELIGFNKGSARASYEVLSEEPNC